MAIQPKFYETLYLVRPDLAEDELVKIQEKLQSIIKNGSGEILRSVKWAEKELAYAINDYTKGVYHILIFKVLPSILLELEKALAFHRNDILRFITVVITEDSSNKNAKSDDAEENPKEQ